MATRLESVFAEIGTRHWKSPDSLTAAQQEISLQPDLAQLTDLVDISNLRTLSIPHGIDQTKLVRSVVVSPKLVVVDDVVPTLCQRPYLREDGSFKSCGGFRHSRSCCPPFAPSLDETRQTLADCQKVVIVQAEGLTDLEEQRQLHFSLLGIEKYLSENEINVVGSWAAGPCRVCPECLGQGDCRSPKSRRFSMEGSGISVFTTMDKIAAVTQDQAWKLNLIDNWGLPNQSEPTFKSVIAIAVK